MNDVIGWFTWQPGLKTSLPTSAGGSEWTRYILDEIVKAGGTVAWLADDEAPSGTLVIDIKECNVIFINWRWAMPEYPERQALYERQMSIIREAVEKKIRVIVHDQDHKISAQDFEYLRKADVLLTTPELFPREGFEELHYPLPYSFTAVTASNRSPFMTMPDLAYVGNVYERYEQAMAFLNPFSKERVVDVFGNWLEPGPDRPGPEKVKADMPNVRFKGRISEKAVISSLLTANSTIHLFKPTYATGFMALRWGIAAAAYTPAFVPRDFRLPEAIMHQFEKYGLMVANGEEMLHSYRMMTEEVWFEAVEAQRTFVSNIMCLSPWLDLLFRKG